MYTEAVEGGQSVDLPDAPKDDTSTLGAAAAGVVSTARDVLSPYVNAITSGGDGGQYAVDKAEQSATGTDAFTFHGWEPTKQLTKEDYEENYATPGGWHPGMTESQATVASSKYQHDLYMQSAMEQHPWATTLGGVAGNLADPLWYFPFADLLKFGVVASRMVDAERAAKPLFDLGEWGERTAKGISQAGLVSSAEEESQDLQGKDPDVFNPLMSMVAGTAIGVISKAIGMPFEYRAAALQKAAADYSMNDPVDVTAAVRPASDFNTELEQELRSENPDANVIQTLMQGHVTPANAQAASITLDKLEGREVSAKSEQFLSAYKGGSKTLDEHLDGEIAQAKAAPTNNVHPSVEDSFKAHPLGGTTKAVEDFIGDSARRGIPLSQQVGEDGLIHVGDHDWIAPIRDKNGKDVGFYSGQFSNKGLIIRFARSTAEKGDGGGARTLEIIHNAAKARGEKMMSDNLLSPEARGAWRAFIRKTGAKVNENETNNNPVSDSDILASGNKLPAMETEAPKSADVRVLEEAKAEQHTAPIDNTPYPVQSETVTLDSPPFNEDGSPMDADQKVDAKVKENDAVVSDAEKSMAPKPETKTGEKSETPEEMEQPEPPAYVRATLQAGKDLSTELRSKAMGLLRALTCRMS